MEDYSYPKKNTFKKVVVIIFIVLLGFIFLVSCAGWIKQHRSVVKVDSNLIVTTEVVVEPTLLQEVNTPSPTPTTVPTPKPTPAKLSDPIGDDWYLVFYDDFGANFWFREVNPVERGCQYVAKTGCSGKTVEVFLTWEHPDSNYFLNGWDLITKKAVFSFDLQIGLNTISVPINVKLGIGTLVPDGVVPTLP